MGAAILTGFLAQEKWKPENGHDSSVKSKFPTTQG